LKKIEAFIRQQAFEPIRSEPHHRGFPSLSISEVNGFGRQQGLGTIAAGAGSAR
jgi:nitrogen regulatory protein P-II 1